MTVRLRPHHLLCILTFVGKGYNPAFTANMRAIAGRLGQGEEILITSGPDDICAPLLSQDAPHCQASGIAARDQAAAREVAALLGCVIATGTRLTLDKARLQTLRQGFATGALRQACHGCDWRALCDDVAQTNYSNARLNAIS